jgi:hypothetical protein
MEPMMIFHTHEVRWFFSGQIPPNVATWFAGRCDPILQPARTDLYLTGTDESLGVKVREGRLEVKQRQGSGEAVRFAKGAKGEVQGWTKWGFDLADPGLANLDGGWLPVRKRRWVRYYQVSREGDLSPFPPGSYPERGGGLELTAVSLPDDREWWTIGVEVFGPDDCRREDLLALMGWLMAGSGGPELLLEDSMGYPAWLVAR